MKNSSKKSIEAFRLHQLQSADLHKLKGGTDAIGIQDIVDV